MKKINLKLADKAKTVVAVVAATAVADAAATVTYNEVQSCRAIYHYYTDTVTVKKHFWSKPVTVRKCNGKVVNK